MADKENCSLLNLEGRYPKRNRTRVKYEEFEMSLEKKPRKTSIQVPDVLSEDGNNEYSSSEQEFTGIANEEEEEEISEYELRRLKNLEENRKIMIELGLIDPNKERKEVLTKAITKRKPKTNIRNVMPKKRSLRLLSKTPDGKELHSSLELFQESPLASPRHKDEKSRFEQEVLPMNDGGESTDFLDSLKSSLSESSTSASQEFVENLIENMRSLELATVKKVNSSRIQSMCIHPMENKLLILSGSKDGELGIWNATDGEVASFTPHLRAVNCITVDPEDHSKFFTTSFDGTLRRANTESSAFEMVYKTSEKTNMCHLTWHSHVQRGNTLLVAHGTGEAAVVDVRTKYAETWYHCHPRSIRTIDSHPLKPHYFLTASGTGVCKIFDLRVSKKHVDECVSEFSPPHKGKGLTSGFFSPDGSKVVTTCNDDFIHIHDVSELEKPKEITRIVHDNHTGQWLSVFKAIWHPQSSDLIIVGSMLKENQCQRQIQMFNSRGLLVKVLRDEKLVTVNSVIALHPTLPMLVGGNSTGKNHLFMNPDRIPQYVKINDADSD